MSYNDKIESILRGLDSRFTEWDQGAMLSAVLTDGRVETLAKDIPDPDRFLTSLLNRKNFIGGPKVEGVVMTFEIYEYPRELQEKLAAMPQERREAELRSMPRPSDYEGHIEARVSTFVNQAGESITVQHERESDLVQVEDLRDNVVAEGLQFLLGVHRSQNLARLLKQEMRKVQLRLRAGEEMDEEMFFQFADKVVEAYRIYAPERVDNVIGQLRKMTDGRYPPS